MDEVTTMSLIKLGFTAAGFCATLVGAAILRDRNVSKRISAVSEKTHERIDALTESLHANFARKDDVKESTRRVESSIKGLGDEMRANHNSITSLILERLK